MRSPQPSSQDSFSQIASKTNKRVRFASNEKFKVNLKTINIQHRQSKFIKAQKASQDLKQSFYFRVRVISKIGVFIEKLKALVALSFPNFKNNQMDYIETQITNDNQNKFLFSAENKLVILFEAILLCISVISIWNVSFLLLFPGSYLLPFELRLSMLVLFALEIIVNLFVMPADSLKQEHKQNHKLVILHYFKNNFLYDAVSLVSLVIIDLVDRQHVILYIVKCLALLKIGTILRVVSKFQAMYVTTPEAESKISILKLMMKILTFVHMLSLTLNLVNQIQLRSGVDKTWLGLYGMGDASDLQMYLCGWYWGATILTTVGFGDIAPANIYEAFIVSLIQIICCAIFGYSINYIGGLIGVLGESTELFEKQMRRVNRYLENLDVSRNLKEEIRQHFYNKQKIKKIHDPVAESIVMDNIPSSMKTQVLSMNNKNVLQKTNFFQRYNDNILNLLAMKLKRIIYSPDEVIFNKGDSNSKLWILEKGNISEFYNNQPNNVEKIIAQYNTTTVQPGYINFITGQPFTTYCRSLGFSWTYQVSREDMLSVLVQFKTEYHKFCQLKDKLIQKGKKFVSRCCACLKLSHNALECPKIHFNARIKLYKLANLSRQNTNIRHFYPRSNQKYKTLTLFSSMADEDSLTANSIHINSHRQMSMQDTAPVIEHVPRQSRRISTILLQRMPHKMANLLPPYLNPSKQRIKTQSQTLKTEEVYAPPEFDYKLWLDQCKFNDTQSYFSESQVAEVLQEYNRLMQQNRQRSKGLRNN